MEFSNRGIPILELGEKVDALKYCMLSGSHEDAMGHLFDLMAFEGGALRAGFVQAGRSDALQSGTWGPDVVVELQQAYGQDPTPIKATKS